jgi:hypothetical protein
VSGLIWLFAAFQGERSEGVTASPAPSPSSPPPASPT